ncbi:MAG: hypothetical protein VW714_13065 [Rhodospirillales bacterium]|jgi:hypothetical protein
MMMKRIILGVILILFSLNPGQLFAACSANASVNGTNSSGASATYLSAASGCVVTPSSYKVTFYKIEFYNSNTSSWVTFIEDSSGVEIDIANFDPGATAGSVGSGYSLAAGTYSSMKITISRNFGILAGAVDSGVGGMPCATSSSNSSTITGTALAGFPLATSGTYDPGSSTQTVPVPDIAAVNSALDAISNVERTTYGGQNALAFTASVSFTIPESAQTLPSLSMTFNVKDTIEFAYDGTYCAVLVTPPSVSF